MKTADLIPFILLELNESDKYGFELTKNIETKSNGQIVIKQPTLYTLLKKLEKSKFITSYWLDSDIGGKRHYYKITDNGKLQLSTLPSYDVLMQNLLASENESVTDTINPEDTNGVEVEITQNETNLDEISKPSTTPLEAVIPTEEVFKDETIDTKTSTELNQANLDLLSDETKKDESFATNVVIAKFVEIKPSTPPTIKQTDNKPLNNLVDLDVNINNQKNEIAYNEYINLKKSPEYKKAKLFGKLTIVRAVSVSFFIIGLLICFAMLSKKFGTSALYYTTLILGLIIAIFYPIITVINIDRIKAKYKNTNYIFKKSISLISKLSILCFILLVVLFVNIYLKNNTFIKLFSIENFANFYVPILMSLSMLIDSLIGNVISLKIRK